MASTIQFSGLSGFDSSSVISALMAVEKGPQNALKSRLATTQSQVSALQQVNSSLAALSTSAKSFATGSTWTQLAAKSSSPAVTVTASSSASPVKVGVTVEALAVSGRGYLSAPPAANTTLTLRKSDGSAFQVKDASGSLVDLTIDSGDGTLAGLAKAINATTKASGLQATVINGATPVLMVTSTATGLSSNFSISDGAGTVLSGTGGADAVIEVNGQSITSTSNTFTDVMPGVTITLGDDAVGRTGTTPGTTASVSVGPDGASRATAMKAFISQLNDVLTQISGATAYGKITDGAAATGGGPLPGDSTLRAVADQLINTVFPAGNGSLAEYGVSIDRYGQFTFDSATFTKAYEADPDAVQAALIGTPGDEADALGFAERVQKVADLASDAYDGSISQYIQNGNAEIDRYNDQIAAWDDRLAAKQASLEQIYTNLETQLNRLQSQQSWLASQIESLDGLSSSKS